MATFYEGSFVPCGFLVHREEIATLKERNKILGFTASYYYDNTI